MRSKNTGARKALETVIHLIFLLCGIVAVGFVLVISVYLILSGLPAIREIGLWNFLFGKEWASTAADPKFGILPFLLTSVYGTAGAILIGVPIGFLTAVFLSKVAPPKVAAVIRPAVDLLAGIPSIVYGLWGFYTLRPLIDMIDGPQGNGYGILTSVLILTVMIIPYASSLTAEFVMLTPKSLKEAAYSLGATRTEVIGSVILPNARSGIVAAYILALGRALGETMAVTMLIGNTDKIPTSLFDTGQSMASLIANQFNEAHGLKLSSLIAIALVLFLITAIINGIVKIILNKQRA